VLPARRRSGSRSTGDPPRRPARSLKAQAIACLARRDYSRAELRERLLSRCDPNSRDAAAAEVDALLDELVAVGYLSEPRYAHAVVMRKAGSYSRRAIAETLKAQGLPAEVVTEALAHAPDDDTEAMIALWRRRFGHPPGDERDKARQVRFLQSRGFALSAILRFLRDPPDA
jgi:regulatory protein